MGPINYCHVFNPNHVTDQINSRSCHSAFKNPMTTWLIGLDSAVQVDDELWCRGPTQSPPLPRRGHVAHLLKIGKLHNTCASCQSFELTISSCTSLRSKPNKCS